MRALSPKLIGVFLLTFIGVLSSASLLRWVGRVTPGRMGKDEISSYLRRFEPLRRVLPIHITVGYESDLEDSLTDREEVRSFYLAQYALAPAIVVAGVEPEVVVGNYRDPARCRVCRSKDFVLMRDFGQGLMLFRRTGR
jgi:hypothetical protein